jgi:hypothetical protein
MKTSKYFRLCGSQFLLRAAQCNFLNGYTEDAREKHRGSQRLIPN